MFTHAPTKEELAQWKAAWEQFKDFLCPNRKSGAELLAYLQNRYELTEIFDARVLADISQNVTQNAYWAEKLPAGADPLPRAFYLENVGNGERFYQPENKDSADLWGGDITKIYLGVNISSGFYQVEGSTLLWDELCAFQGLDEKDLQNYVRVAQYLAAQKRVGKLESSPENRVDVTR